MIESLKQKIEEQIKFLPKESQEAINSFDWIKTSEEIGKKYFLTEYEINNLQAEIAVVVLGLEDQEFLALNIEDSARTSKNHSEKMAEEVIEKILKPIVENLSEKIKIDLKNRSIHWQQNLDFILSGGDYTAFIREPAKEIKNKIPESKDSFNPSRIDDLKSKFTI